MLIDCKCFFLLWARLPVFKNYVLIESVKKRLRDKEFVKKRVFITLLLSLMLGSTNCCSMWPGRGGSLHDRYGSGVLM